jgi:hypothetical protein
LDVGGRLNCRERLNVGGRLNGRRRLTIVWLRRRHVDRRRRNSDEARQRVCESQNPGTDCRYRQHHESYLENSRRTQLCGIIGALNEKERQWVMVRGGAVVHGHRGMPPLIVLVE